MPDNHPGDVSTEERRELAELRCAFENSGAPGAVLSVDRRVVRANNRLGAILGRDRSDLIGELFDACIHPDDRASCADMVERLLAGEPIASWSGKRLIRNDGGFLTADASFHVTGDAREKRTFCVIFFKDRAEENRLLAHQKLLVQELSHRTKNLLTVVQVLARQIARHAASSEDFEGQFVPRLAGLAASHDLIAERDWAGVDLEDVIRRQLRLFKPTEMGRVVLTGPPIKITPATAQNIGMAVHELASNACKYGALSTPRGHVDIVWSNGPDAIDDFEISWTETGGPLVKPPARAGFGHIVAREMVAYALNGAVEMSFDDAGFKWRLTAPGSALVGPARSPA